MNRILLSILFCCASLFSFTADFNSDTNGFAPMNTGACALSLSNSGYEGGSSLLVSSRQHSYDGPGLVLTGLSKDKTYVVRARVKRTATVSENYQMMVKVGASGYRELNHITVVEDKWYKMRGFLRLSEADLAAGVTLYFNTNTTTNNFLLDSVEVVEPAYAAPATSLSTDFVRAKGSALVIGADEKPYRFRGVNVIAYNDDQTVESVDFFKNSWHAFDEYDFNNIAKLGFNAVRLSLWYKTFQYEDGTFRADGFEWLDIVVGWAKNAGIKVMLDMHAPQGGGFQGPAYTGDFWTNTAHKNNFKAFWVEIAKRYKNEPTVLGYDIINEPKTPSQSTYETLLLETIDAIRTHDTNHLINVEHDIFRDDMFVLDRQNIVYDFHHYLPWDMYTKHTINVYPGTGTLSKDDVQNYARDIFEYYKTNNRPANISEFGQERETFDENRGALTWVDDVVSVIDEYEANSFYFSYRGNEFGIYDNKSSFIDELSVPNQALADFFVSKLVSKYNFSTKGWHLLGGDKYINASALLAHNPSVELVWTYRNGEWRLATKNNMTTTYQKLENIFAGDGFWVLVK